MVFKKIVKNQYIKNAEFSLFSLKILDFQFNYLKINDSLVFYLDIYLLKIDGRNHSKNF